MIYVLLVIIACVQDHWLMGFQIHKFKNIHDEYISRLFYGRLLDLRASYHGWLDREAGGVDPQ